MIVLAYAILILLLAFVGAAAAGIPGLAIVLVVSAFYVAWRADQSEGSPAPAGTAPETSEHSGRVCERCRLHPATAGGRVCSRCEGELLEADRAR